MTKQELRGIILSETKALATEEKKRQSLIICNKIKQSNIWKKAKTIALYMPLKTEPDIRLLMEEAVKTKKRILLPVIENNTIELVLYKQDVPLVRHSLGFLQPKNTAKESILPELILVPGVAFDNNKKRLGRGGGYYDRLLSSLPPDCIKIGVCYSTQLTKEIPSEKHDIAMDIIITA
ncbi:5-formyltetrahydrofolate cyclo-ligase [Spirochaetia bacterium 38H-sp]|uniref:5-formyltetrahydrofolate cyclo-ligase n=1 Tax=Rarispira pelagica TaxID=3141764 RepID=A0ABU9U9W7_9SPIR